MNARKYLLSSALCAVGVVLLFAGVASAQDLTQSYMTGSAIQKGTIVRLDATNPTKVEPLTQDGAKDVLGVVVSANDTPVALATEGEEQQVFVATMGRYDALVSTQNGNIAPGDLITISSFAGIGMRADERQEVVLGKALRAFTDKDGVSTATLKDGGQEVPVALGRIPVDIVIGANPLYHPDTPEGVPKFLARAAEVVTNKPIGAVRIYASLAILVIAVAIAGGILYAGVRSGMIAVGRNPLAKRSITRGLVQVVLVSLIVFIIGLVAVYLLLRL